MSENEAMLHRAFVDGKADYIQIDSRRQRRQIESANFGVDQGWLTCRMEGADVQSSALIFRLTDKGRKHFGIAK